MESKLVCRTCLVDTGELFEVFGDTGNELSLSTKISEHLKISIEPLDEYALMCGRCIGILNEFHDMYSLAHEIQPHFTDYKNVEVQQDEEIVTAEYIVEEEDEEEMVNHMEEVIIEEAVPDYGTEFVHSDPENEAEEEEVEEGEISVEETPNLTLAPGQRKQSRTEQSAARIEEENELVRQVINLACTDCDAVPLTFDDLMLHYREVHLKDGILTCCKREFNQRRKVVEHAKLHVNPAEFSCVECKKNFASKYYLTHHMSIHVPEELCEYPCEKCTKRFPTKSRLTNHMKVHNEYDLSCHICGKAFNHKPTLYNHIRSVHEQATQLTCGVCSKVFKTREGYQSHMVSHMETPPPRVTCHICGKKMKNRDTLNQHLQRHKHENDRIYCEICNREFNCKKRLNQHRKYVHNPVLLKCEHCEKTFKRPICLKEHMASHTGQQLYTCAYCPRQFNSNANKYSHQKAQHRAEWSLDKQRKEMEG